MKFFYTYIVFPIIWLFSLLPFWILYGISDFFYVIIRLVGYRKKVIMENLRFSFPEKAEGELVTIRNKFYRHFSDLFVETLKLYTIKEKTIRKRVTFKNIEYVDKLFDEGKDVLAVMAHYGNWEYVPNLNLHTKHTCCAVYRPLRNKQFDQFMLFIRSRFGNLNFTMKNSLRDVLTLKKKKHRYILGLISDQTPGGPEIQYFTKFLNQNTPVHLGAEKMGKLFKDEIVYLNMDKLKRGYYQVTVEPLIQNPTDMAEHEITDIHTKHLEQIIQKRPELWLWSHRRWKHAHPRTIQPENQE